MLKKTITTNSQVVTTVDKPSSIPHDFEPVSRRMQDEEKDTMFQIMGDRQNADISQSRNDDDEENSDDAYHAVDLESPEDRAVHEEDSQSTDE